jgi:hypothetical protein
MASGNASDAAVSRAAVRLPGFRASGTQDAAFAGRPREEGATRS